MHKSFGKDIEAKTKWQPFCQGKPMRDIKKVQ